MPTRRKISLVLADVDGTLVTEEKVLTPRAQAAVRRLHDARIRFAITSGRPPLGMKMLVEALCLDTPIAGFNGGLFVTPELSILTQKPLANQLARRTVDCLRGAGLDVWVYRGNDWLVSDAAAPHVAREAWTVKFEPRVCADLAQALDGVVKVVGVSDDHARVASAEAAAREALGRQATVARSQPYYVDVTHSEANKGAVLAYLVHALDVPAAEVAALGDQPNDVRMFERSGLSIAMGNAPAEVKAKADVTTDSNREEGFAKAIERYILGFHE